MFRDITLEDFATSSTRYENLRGFEELIPEVMKQNVVGRNSC
jgi:hypothetical protein